MSFAQFFICTFGVASIWLSQSNGTLPRYACLAGLAAQPFWFYETYTAEQWGIFIISFLYTWSWLKGFKKYWLAPHTTPPRTEMRGSE